MSMPIPPINADARSSVEIEDSCNCCIGIRRRPVHRAPQRHQTQVELTPTALKVKSASAPVLTQTAIDEWEIKIDGQNVDIGQPNDPVAASIVAAHGGHK